MEDEGVQLSSRFVTQLAAWVAEHVSRNVVDQEWFEELNFWTTTDLEAFVEELSPRLTNTEASDLCDFLWEYLAFDTVEPDPDERLEYYAEEFLDELCVSVDPCGGSGG